MRAGAYKVLSAARDWPHRAAAAGSSDDGRRLAAGRPTAANGRRARLYRPARSVMQSAPRTGVWVLEFEPASKPWIDPLMGWTASSDVDQQIRLTFRTRQAALRYALRHGLNLDVAREPSQALVPAFARGYGTGAQHAMPLFGDWDAITRQAEQH
jgi:hypothetical protein